MSIDENMIISEQKPKHPLYLRYANISCNDYGEADKIVNSLAITLENLESFTVNRALTEKEVEILTKNGFLVTSTICHYDNSSYYPPLIKGVVETYVERIRNRTY